MPTTPIRILNIRTYTEEEDSLLSQAEIHFSEQSTNKAIKRALFYLFKELPKEIKYYRDIERKYNTLRIEHERLKDALRMREKAEKEINQLISKSV